MSHFLTSKTFDTFTRTVACLLMGQKWTSLTFFFDFEVLGRAPPKPPSRRALTNSSDRMLIPPSLRNATSSTLLEKRYFFPAF